MRYIYLELSEEEKKTREKKKWIENHRQEAQAKLDAWNAWNRLPQSEKGTEPERVDLTTIGALCGDKELLVSLLEQPIEKEMKGADGRRWYKLLSKIESLEDPCWLELAEDDYAYIKDRLNAIDLAKKVIDQQGNKVNFYSTWMVRRSCKFLDLFETATDQKPEELKEKEIPRKPQLHQVEARE